MRQCKKRAVQIAKILDIFWRLDKFHLSQTEKISMNVADTFSGVFIGRDENDFDIRMKQQNPQQF